MAIFNFFKAPKIRQYHHEFIYYDPKKEERQERQKRVRAKLGLKEDEKYHPLIRRGTFQELRKTKTPSASSRNTRLLLMIGAVIVILYFYMK